MRAELRSVNASILAGFTDIIVGLLMFFTGWHQWYFDHFHFFGIMGLSMLFYGYWYIFLLRKEGAYKWVKKNIEKKL